MFCDVEIFLATEVEPIAGWYDNLNGPMGLVMVGALGINHVVNIPGSSEMNMIPVDICVKGMIVAAQNVWTETHTTTPVYNAASIKLVTYDSLVENDGFVRDNPSMQAIGGVSVKFTTCVYYAWMLRIFRNIIPAIILDGLLCIAGKKPK